jgi:hypothetical protein
MARSFIFILLFLLSACKTIQLSSGLTDQEAYRLYKETMRSDSVYNVKFNQDSSFAICILNDGSDTVSEPISFFVIDIHGRKKALVSLNEYHKAEWMDSDKIRLIKITGMPDMNRNLNKNPKSNFKVAIFDVTSGQLQPEESSSEIL